MLENGGNLRLCGTSLHFPQRTQIGLANRWFQPLTHVSSGGSPRVSAISCQRAMREKREEQRFAVAQSAAQSVRASFRPPNTPITHKQEREMSDNGWRPIDEAPKDRPILAWMDDCTTLVLQWKTNDRLAPMREAAKDVPEHWVHRAVDSYFGIPGDSEDYDLALPENTPSLFQLVELPSGRAS